MARLIGSKPRTSSERAIYKFVMEQLPDYIYALFSTTIETIQGPRDCDAILFIPHMGVYVFEIKGARKISVSDDQILIHDMEDRTKPYRPEKLDALKFAVLRHLRLKFNLLPNIYDIQCFPRINSDPELNRQLTTLYPGETFLFCDHLKDSFTFLQKMHECRIREKRLLDKNEPSTIDPRLFCDLTDQMAYNIFRFWETGMKEPDRPSRPPMLFLSHSSLNAIYAKEITQDIESKGVFVWHATDDIPIGTFYKDKETKAIEDSDAFLILLSSASQISSEVLYEFETARTLGKPILPLWIEDCEINDYFKENLQEYQYRIMPKLDAKIMDEIVETIKALPQD
ncbi:MAG: toll/interleukin-1 receptor domain-containing protein [Clostridiales bacterium]|nr:toll/interleukin-1 receptor domain-containing protein [Clostridiales bacterium]